MLDMELKTPPLVQLLVYIYFIWLIGWLYPVPIGFISYTDIIGLLICIVGVAISVAGVVTFRNAETTIDPRYPDKTTHLVVSGIYKYSRNPMYLGFLIILIAAVFYFNSLCSLLIIPLFVLSMNLFQIIPEEKVLSNKFGDSFAEYRTKTRRWL